MYNRLTVFLLHWLRVPPEPHPPHGDPASLRVFRAGRNFYNLRLFRWGFAQLLALAGIIFWVTVFVQVEAEVQARRATTVKVNPADTRNFEDYVRKIGAADPSQPATLREQIRAAAGAAEASTRVEPARPGDPSAAPATPQAAPAQKAKPRPLGRINGWRGFKIVMLQLALWLPPWAFPIIWVLKIAGILGYLAQLPATYALARLDYEMRWYMVTDRSLRIRHGVWKVSESTMSFANIQQVEVSQGPLQRLLNLADVKVQSAGGGSGVKEHQHGTEDDLHHGLFHSVTNAAEIRDLILERLRRFRESGLGDPEESHHAAAVAAAALPATGEAAGADVLAAARELAAEAKALRAALM